MSVRFYNNSVYVVIEKGKYKPTIKSVATKEYKLWTSMLSRCYSEKLLKRCPTYYGCSVSENFKNFQYFAEWCNNQKGFGNKGWHLDKDLLVKGNKIYSENTCVFVPPEINSLIKNSRGVCKLGVYKTKECKYCATIKIKGKSINLGTFLTELEAAKVYKIAKEKQIKEVVLNFKDKIDENLYNLMLNYQIDIGEN